MVFACRIVVRLHASNVRSNFQVTNLEPQTTLLRLFYLQPRYGAAIKYKPQNPNLRLFLLGEQQTSV